MRIYFEAEFEPAAAAVARRLPDRFELTPDRPPTSGWYLTLNREGLALKNAAERGDFRLRMTPVRRRVRQGAKLAIARACGVRPGLKVLDALAGWGTDGLVLDQLGCDVLLTECNPMVFALLDDLVRRSDARATVELVDARKRMGDGFDVIYLDPMFDPHPKTALPAKRMQVLQQIAGVDAPDTAELIALARQHARERVVLKRRARSDVLDDPAWQIGTKSIRFDIYRPRV